VTTAAAPRTILIGDVHGCVDELRALLRAAEVTGGDRVILVGDLVAKGPDSQGVVQLARESGFAAVLGNHDAKVLKVGGVASADQRTSPPASEPSPPSEQDPGTPVRSRPPSPDTPKDHEAVARALTPADWSYLAELPLYRELADLDTIVVHAGLVPGPPLANQPRKFLLNLRSILPNGQPSKRSTAGVPWASLWPGPRRVVFGHDAMRGLQRHPFATGLDTGCVYGGRLTALILPEGELRSVAARRAYRPF